MRLSTATLAGLPQDVARPAYDRATVARGVVHLGIGAFHRAHQAVVFEAALASGDARWGITAASLRSPAARDALGPQDGLYTLVEPDRLQVIGAVQEVIVAPENPAALLAALAAPDTHIVTLTITEKGYYLDPASGALMRDAPGIAADLADPTKPVTAIGYLVAALAARRDAGLRPFTAISCDNLPHNGRRLQGAVLQLAKARDPALAAWIAAEGAFPETMVDRIVPATVDADIAALSRRLGVEDLAMVKTEPFLQWVIEDRFCGPRPDFASLGVQITDAVAPWEEAKLRLLNGAHSAIAYLGGLAGIAFVHEVVAIPAFRQLVEALWDESAATLSPPSGLNVAEYRVALMARFANPSLQHRTHQIAMDGSQKLPQRLLAPIAARRAQGLPVDTLALAVAGWIRWQSGRDDTGATFKVDDPLAETIQARLAGTTDAAARVEAIVTLEAIFPPALAADTAFKQTLARHLATLDTQGARAAIGG